MEVWKETFTNIYGEEVILTTIGDKTTVTSKDISSMNEKTFADDRPSEILPFTLRRSYDVACNWLYKRGFRY